MQLLSASLARKVILAAIDMEKKILRIRRNGYGPLQRYPFRSSFLNPNLSVFGAPQACQAWVGLIRAVRGYPKANPYGLFDHALYVTCT